MLGGRLRLARPGFVQISFRNLLLVATGAVLEAQRADSARIVPKFGWHENCLWAGLSSRCILATILTSLDEVLYKLFVLEKSTRELAKELGTPTLFP